MKLSGHILSVKISNETFDRLESAARVRGWTFRSSDRMNVSRCLREGIRRVIEEAESESEAASCSEGVEVS